MKRKYCEKLYEDLIKEFPKEFLGEEFTLISQQPTYNGYRPDLIFKDASGVFVIVEIQLNQLDNSHFYRSLEYRDYIIHSHLVETARVILVCNSLTERHRKRVSVHDVTCIEICKKEFIKKSRILVPNLQIIQPKIEKQGFVSTENIITRLNKNKKAATKVANIDAIVRWILPEPYYGREYIKFSFQDLRKIGKNAGKLFYSHREGYDVVKVNNITEDDIYITKQLIYSDIVNSISDVDRSGCKDLLEFLKTYFAKKGFNYSDNTNDLFIPLFTGDIPVFEDIKFGMKRDYESFIAEYHISKNEFDINRFNKYIELINKCHYFTGKYPNLEIVKLFESVEISHEMPIKLKDQMASEISKFSDEDKEYWWIKASEGLWTSIKIKNFNRQLLTILYDTNRFFAKKENSNTNRLMKDIDEDAFLLSSKYFADLKFSQ